jgi:hypothetical protein
MLGKSLQGKQTHSKNKNRRYLNCEPHLILLVVAPLVLGAGVAAVFADNGAAAVFLIAVGMINITSICLFRTLRTK